MGYNERLLVIGGVAAGMSAASAARRVDPSIKATVLEKDRFISYGICSLPYYVSGDVANFGDLISLTPEMAGTERGITVLTRHEALKIDSAQKTVLARSLDDGIDLSFPYDKLVIAMGALPVKPPLPGIDLENIFTVRTLSDGIEIRKLMDQWDTGQDKRGTGTREAVIVGGGYVGMEMCESFRKRGCKVTVLEKTDRVLGTMDLSIASVVEETLVREGVNVVKGSEVLAFEGDGGMVSKVITSRGALQADLVLLAIGARPNSGLARDAGIKLGIANAIEVDNLQQTSVPDIYAAGDCAEAIHLVTGRKAYIPLGTTANKQGRIAGENAAGKKHVFEGIAGTALTKIFSLEVARTGLSPIEADREGYRFFSSTVNGRSRSTAYPGGKPIIVSYFVEEETSRRLGKQMVGEEGTALRFDTLDACIYGKMTVEDVARLDLGYAPPFATVWDPILIAANVALKRLEKGATP